MMSHQMCGAMAAAPIKKVELVLSRPGRFFNRSDLCFFNMLFIWHF